MTDEARPRTIDETIARWARKEPQRVAVRASDTCLTYAELDDRAARVAACLMAAGVRPGDVVALPGTREPATIVALLAILKAGAAYLALDPADPSRWEILLNDAQVAAVVSHSPLPGHRVVSIVEADHVTHVAATVPADLERVAYVAYTSGSTGEPKGVRVPHRAIIRLVVDAEFLPVRPDDVFLQFAPLAFDASTLEVWGALANGACLVLAPQGELTPARLAGVVRDEEVTVLWLTAGLFHQVVETSLGELRGLRVLLAGGDVLSVERVNQAFAALPNTMVINGYGPTENTTFTCCHRVREPVRNPSVPIGKPIDRSRAYVLDANLTAVADGEAGELYAAGDGVALGYLGRPAATAARFLPDPFSTTPGARMYRTGDLARVLPDGALEFLGRVDNQVKARGYRIELEAVEAAMRMLPGVSDVVVAAPRTASGDRKLVAFVAPRRESDVSTLALRDALTDRLPGYAVPSVIRLLDTLPLRGNGKVDRAALEQRTGSVRPELSAPHREPAGPVEAAVVQLWADLLDIDGVGADDDFFELGGHSLLAVRILDALERRYGTEISPLRFYLDPCPAGLARHISGVAAVDAP